MTCEINKCFYCNYNSNRLYNLKRHMMTKHNEIHINKITSNNYNDDNAKLTADDAKLTDDNAKLTVDNEKHNDVNGNECCKCHKILSSKQNLNKHLLICKGVLNPFECHFCHKILSDRSSKSRHKKICKQKKNNELIEIDNNNELIEIDNNNEIRELSTLTITNNSNNIINNSNNVINNNNTYNINLVSYNKENRTITFDITHMKDNIMYKLRTIHENDAFDYFCYKLFENKNNQMIIKTNLRHIYSKVHTGFNIWEKILDNNIYHIIIYYISDTMNSYIINNTSIEDRDNDNVANILYYVKMMSSRMNMDKFPRKYDKYYKDNIESLKLKFADFED